MQIKFCQIGFKNYELNRYKCVELDEETTLSGRNGHISISLKAGIFCKVLQEIVLQEIGDMCNSLI